MQLQEELLAVQHHACLRGIVRYIPTIQVLINSDASVLVEDGEEISVDMRIR